MERTLEPEMMDTWAEAIAYDAMDFTAVNTDFAEFAIALGPPAATSATVNILDLGTGTARIPILIAQRRPQWQIVAIDLSENMLKVGANNVQAAGCQAQISLEWVDAKQLPYHDAQFDLVIANSIVHHLPNPLPCLREVQRVLKPGGGLLLRDLLRPADRATVEAIVARMGPEYDAHQAQLFHDSLCAAFTLAEVEAMVTTVGLVDVQVYQSSDRHWTIARPWSPQQSPPRSP
ncbi:class I SAM-dependent methyltransferase [Trichothermofontia sp.]